MIFFHDRFDAGKRLAAELERFRCDRPVVVGLARGGVSVAFEIARALEAPLVAWFVRKIATEPRPDVALGAIAEGGEVVFHADDIAAAGIAPDELSRIVERERLALEGHVRRLRSALPSEDLRDRTIIVVDDGIATGSSVEAALRSLRKYAPRKLIVAVPVADQLTIERLWREADEIVYLERAQHLETVGAFYDAPSHPDDDDIVDLVRRAWTARAKPAERGRGAVDREVCMRRGPTTLTGRLTIPQGATAVVAVARSDDFTSTNAQSDTVAERLRKRGIGTLVLGLLTARELDDAATAAAVRFDAALLSERLVLATDWLLAQPETRRMPIGYFGASSAASAALIAATRRPERVGAVVSCGGRPDLARDALPQLRTPTLLLVADVDPLRADVAQSIVPRVDAPCELVVVKGASMELDERATLKRVGDAAARWFKRHLTRALTEATATDTP